MIGTILSTAIKKRRLKPEAAFKYLHIQSA